ncbi:MAG: site-specific tyrosine recombinase XerC [Proteobacteria bacterium]|nr:site-specific tyrosine recombinase XerC [Pseudomonadota bacterium]
MPRRGHRKAKRPVGDPNDPECLGAWMRRYLEWMRIQHYSERTVENRESYLSFFVRWCEQRSLGYPQEITKPILERYQRHLFYFRKDDGKALSFRAQHSRLVPVRAFFKWLTRHNVLLYNPASELELPRLEMRLPRHVLSAVEAEQILAIPEVREPLGLRDRAILEVLYSTGIRRSELIKLSVYDLDTERSTLMVRQGKGRKDRMVPIGARAIAWLRKYLDGSRPELVIEPDDGSLFLTHLGESFTPSRLTQLVRGYVRAAELDKSGSCHLFRHTMATLMLEGGADIRYIQAMLGHVDLSTTQIYTQVSIRKLQQVHAMTHPAARLEARTACRDQGSVASGQCSGDDELPATPDVLLATLASEVLEEERDPDEQERGGA